MEITEKEKAILLLAARNSIKSLFEKVELPDIDYNLHPVFKLNMGAFVTLKIDGNLRGCIGYIATKKSLYDTVIEAAKQSALKDPRFLPLTSEELDYVTIEISVLSPLQKISDYSQIVIGRHGLILDEEYSRAVLLPQVAISNNYTTELFLSALCEKAGLPPDQWNRSKLNLMVFTAIVFSEEEVHYE